MIGQSLQEGDTTGAEGVGPELDHVRVGQGVETWGLLVGRVYISVENGRTNVVARRVEEDEDERGPPGRRVLSAVLLSSNRTLHGNSPGDVDDKKTAVVLAVTGSLHCGYLALTRRRKSCT